MLIKSYSIYRDKILQECCKIYYHFWICYLMGKHKYNCCFKVRLAYILTTILTRFSPVSFVAFFFSSVFQLFFLIILNFEFWNKMSSYNTLLLLCSHAGLFKHLQFILWFCYNCVPHWLFFNKGLCCPYLMPNMWRN